VEVKNINSFTFVEKAIAYEIKRQADILDAGKTPSQETRGFVEAGSKTVSQRSKEEAADYRYFPEPDIPPIMFTNEKLSEIKRSLPELPDIKKARFEKEYSLSSYNADLITKESKTANFFEETVSAGEKEHVSPVAIANWIINKKIDTSKTHPSDVIFQIKQATTVSGITIENLQEVLKKIIADNDKVVSDYKNGKENAIMFLVGLAMKELKGKEKADIIKETLRKLLA